MTSGSLPANPFVAAGMIEDSRLFVGRKDELHAIASRMGGAQPTSINIVGEKRIGKSSLLYHFFLTWEQRVQNPSRYVVIYLSLQSVHCQREENFYLAVAQELLNFSNVATNQALSDPLRIRPLDRVAFSDAIREWKRQGVLPVLCLDDFKTLFDNQSEFNNDFYNNLRSLMNHNSVMLVIASQHQLDFYSKKHQLTSSFFNLGHVIKLGELQEDEVKDLLRLPASTVNNAAPALSMDEQRLTQQLAGSHPFLLQIAGGLVCEARQQGHDENWVKTRFVQESRRLPQSRLGSRRWWLGLRWLVWNLPIRLGRVVKFLGGTVDDVSSWIKGMAILVMVILVFTRVINWNEVWDFVRDQLGIK
ncbi:ATP-binding protein [Nostoc spongiaeforme FACHB-130]|uniref:ATP-binding protein n=1 Tax=Nostoc spongiaeforme FACHB-130 TaxID=1357510 RepID=A0ABR8G618_9NOSO|nr:ATP-binding protein [Nostoc spongiaeforme]MBD2598627.1 ATP-binding protein [Nostoc spongiaeforme FACHB-130]